MSIVDATRVSIAERLKAARELAGLSQGQAARILELHRPSISEVEAGRRRVSAEELVAFARIYSVSVAWLVGDKSDPDTDVSPRLELAARELSKLKPDDLNRVMGLLSALRRGDDAQ